jgi:hypothetical protein
LRESGGIKAGRRRRWRRGIGRGEAEGFVDGFDEDVRVDRLLVVGDCTCFESGMAIADGGARAEDDNGNDACVEEHLKVSQDDEAVAGGEAEIAEDEVGLFFAGGADGGEAVAGGGDFETGGFRRRARAVSCRFSSSTIRIFFPAIATRVLCDLEKLVGATERGSVCFFVEYVIMEGILSDR